MTRQEFAVCMAVLEAAYPRTGKLSQQQLVVWFDNLSDLTVEQLRHAVTVAVREGDDWPTISKLRRYSGADGIESKDQPLAAWQAVREAIRKVGGYESPCFDDPVIHTVIRELGGWPLVCDTPSSEMHWLEKRFCAAYSALCNAKLREDQTRRLHGLCEISNGREGYLNEPIHVAHVRCLTGTGGDEEFVTRRLEQSIPPQTQEPKRPDASTEKLSISLSLDTSGELDDSETDPIKPVIPPAPIKSKSQQIVELKRIANRSSDQSEAG
jgi:hypothetical protein